MRGHVNSLGRLDKEIVAQLDVFRDAYRLATDNESMKRIYKIEASIDKLVAERVRRFLADAAGGQSLDAPPPATGDAWPPSLAPSAPPTPPPREAAAAAPPEAVAEGGAATPDAAAPGAAAPPARRGPFAGVRAALRRRAARGEL